MPLWYSKQTKNVAFFVHRYRSDDWWIYKAEVYYVPNRNFKSSHSELLTTFKWMIAVSEHTLKKIWAYLRHEGGYALHMSRDHLARIAYQRMKDCTEREPWWWTEFEDVEGYFRTNALDLTLEEQMDLHTDKEVEREYLGQRVLAPPRRELFYYETGVENALG